MAFMEKLVDLLSLFEEATTFLRGSNYVTLSLMHPTISELKSEFLTQITSINSEDVDFTNSTTILDIEDEEEVCFEEEVENDIDEIIDPVTHGKIKINQPMVTNGIIDRIKNIILQALNKYWDVPSDIGFKAAYLDPRFKDLLFTSQEEKIRIEQILREELQLLFPTIININNNESGNRENISRNINGKYIL